MEIKYSVQAVGRFFLHTSKKMLGQRIIDRNGEAFGPPGRCVRRCAALCVCVGVVCFPISVTRSNPEMGSERARNVARKSGTCAAL